MGHVFGDGSGPRYAHSHEYTQPEGKTLAELDVKAGDVVECVRDHGFNNYVVGKEYTADGAGNILNERKSEIQGMFSKFRIVSRATPQPTIWRDMTDAEKGAMLLAKHEGKAIEVFFGDKWTYRVGYLFGDNTAYRIKPTPKVDAVTVCDDGIALVSGVSLTRGHRITFNTIDGKPDTASIKMEKLQ